LPIPDFGHFQEFGEINPSILKGLLEKDGEKFRHQVKGAIKAMNPAANGI
jgi:hypothetical protein